MLATLTGWRTIIVAVILVLYGLATAFGVDIPSPNSGAALTMGGIVMGLLRLITKTPVGSNTPEGYTPPSP